MRLSEQEFWLSHNKDQHAFNLSSLWFISNGHFKTLSVLYIIM